VNTVCHTQNRCLVVKRHGKTAYEVFRGKKPQIEYFHVFGCPVFILNNKDHLRKFDPKADDGYFLGYSCISKAFRVFNTRTQKVDESIHVTFDESQSALKEIQSNCDSDLFNEFSYPGEEIDSFVDAPTTLDDHNEDVPHCEHVAAHIYSIEPVEPILRSINAVSATTSTHDETIAAESNSSQNAVAHVEVDTAPLLETAQDHAETQEFPCAEPILTVDLSSYSLDPITDPSITPSAPDMLTTNAGSSNKWTADHPLDHVIGNHKMESRLG